MTIINTFFADEIEALNKYYRELNALREQNPNMYLSTCGYESLITYHGLDALFKAHGNNTATEPALKPFKDFLKNRWAYIQNTGMAYLHPQDEASEINTICAQIARRVTEINTIKKAPTNTVLMPELADDKALPPGGPIIDEKDEPTARLLSNDPTLLTRDTAPNDNLTERKKIWDGMLREAKSADVLINETIKVPHEIFDLMVAVNNVYPDLDENNTLSIKIKLSVFEFCRDGQNTFLNNLLLWEDYSNPTTRQACLKIAMHHLKQQIDMRLEANSPYKEIWNDLHAEINKVTRKKISLGDFNLLMEFIYRAGLSLANPVFARNNPRCIELANKLGQRSWGRIIGGLFLCAVGLTCASLLIAASCGATFAFSAFFAKQVVAGIAGTISSLLVVGGSCLTYRSKHHFFKSLEDRGFFQPDTNMDIEINGITASYNKPSSSA